MNPKIKKYQDEARAAGIPEEFIQQESAKMQTQQPAQTTPANTPMVGGAPAVKPKSTTAAIGGAIAGFGQNIVAQTVNPVVDLANVALQTTKGNEKNKGDLLKSVKSGGERTLKTVTSPEAGKVAAETASFAVPYGKAGFVGSKYVAPGAAQGLLTGVSQGDSAEELVGDTALGGGIGGGLQMGGKALKLLAKGQNAAADTTKKAGAGINNAILNPQAPADVFYSTNIDELESVATQLGLNKGSAKARLDKLPTIFKDIDGQIKPQLEKVTAPIDDNIVSQNFDTQLSKNSTFAADDPALIKARDQVWQRFFNLGKTGGESAPTIFDAKGNLIQRPVTPKTAIQIYQLKSELRGELTQAFNKIEKGNMNLTPVEEAKMAMYQGLKTTIDTVAPDVRKLNDIEHYMFDMSTGLVKKAKQPGVPLGAVNIPIPAQPLQGAVSKVGTALENVGGAKLPMPQMPGTIAGQTATRVGLGIGDNPAEGQQTQGNTYDNNNIHSAADSITNGEESQMAQYVTGYSPEELGQAYTAALTAGDKGAVTMLKQMYDMETKYQETNAKGKEGEPLPVTMQNRVDLAKSGSRGLLEAKALYENDQAVLLKQEIPGQWFSRQFDSAMFRTVEALLRARSGAAVPEQEVYRYMTKYAPRFGDTPDVVDFKFKQLEQDFQDVFDGAQNTAGAGLDILNTPAQQY